MKGIVSNLKEGKEPLGHFPDHGTSDLNKKGGAKRIYVVGGGQPFKNRHCGTK